MNKSLKSISIIAVAGLMAAGLYLNNSNDCSTSSCASNSTQVATNNASLNPIGSFNTPDPVSGKTAGVYSIKNVSKPTKGKAVDFTYIANGKEKSFAELTKGKVVFLNFWGTWCPPCRREIPDIIKIQKELGHKDFIVVGIALEKRKPYIENVQKFGKSKGVNYINIIDANGELGGAYGGIQYVPTTFIIDKKGKISDKVVGGNSHDSFMGYIKKVL